MALRQYLFEVLNGSGLSDYQDDAEGVFAFLLGPASPEVPVVLCYIPMVLVVLAMKVLIVPRGLSRHLIRPLKMWLILDFLQHPMYWF